MPPKTQRTNSDFLHEGLVLLHSIIEKNDIKDDDVKAMRCYIDPEEDLLPLELDDASTAEEVKNNILKNTFSITTHYFFDHHKDRNGSIKGHPFYEGSVALLVFALRMLPRTSLNEKDFSEEVIHLIQFCFELCPASKL